MLHAIVSTLLWCSSGLTRPATRFNAVQDYRTLLLFEMSVHGRGRDELLDTVFYKFHCSSGFLHLDLFSMQFKTLEPRYTFKCSSWPSNFAIRFNVVRDHWSLQCSSGLSNLAARFNAVQDHRTLLYFLMQVRTLELRYTFQCSSNSRTLP